MNMKLCVQMLAILLMTNIKSLMFITCSISRVARTTPLARRVSQVSGTTQQLSKSPCQRKDLRPLVLSPISQVPNCAMHAFVVEVGLT